MGAALFGYTKLYGQVPGGQAEYLRVPFGNTLPIVVPEGLPDERFVYLSDVLPTAWQAVEYAGIPKDGSVVVLGLGPIGDMSVRIARHRGAQRVIGVDLVPECLARARLHGIDVLDLREHRDDLGDVIREMTGGRGPDAVIDAVGMEAHGSPSAKIAQQMAGLLPDAVAAPQTHSRSSRCSTSRSSSGWGRRTSGGGCPTSCRCSPTATRWAWMASPPTRCRWIRPHGIRDLPEEARRRHQDPPATLINPRAPELHSRAVARGAPTLLWSSGG